MSVSSWQEEKKERWKLPPFLVMRNIIMPSFPSLMVQRYKQILKLTRNLEKKSIYIRLRRVISIQTKRAVETASLNPKEGSPADIPTADGAKVQQNSETDKESEEIFNFHKVEDGEKHIPKPGTI